MTPYLSRRMRGFSLLEMIAALTILAIGSVVIFSWLGQTMNHLTRFENQEKESLARLQAVEYLSIVNPSIAPSGKQSFETFRIEWQSEPVREVRETVSPSGGLGIYQTALYDVQVATFNQKGQAWFRFPVKLIGYKQVRAPAQSTPF